MWTHTLTLRLPLAKQTDVGKKLEGMKQLGVIEESDSKKLSPFIFLRNKNRDLRLCVDYRKVSDFTLME